MIPKIIENTECIIAECNFEFEFKTPKTHTKDLKMICNYYANEGLEYMATNVLARASGERIESY
jgi:DNA polymerase-3 subunit alpha/error-prone DNA polymerase